MAAIALYLLFVSSFVVFLGALCSEESKWPKFISHLVFGAGIVLAILVVFGMNYDPVPPPGVLRNGLNKAALEDAKYIFLSSCVPAFGYYLARICRMGRRSSAKTPT